MSSAYNKYLQNLDTASENAEGTRNLVNEEYGERMAHIAKYGELSEHIASGVLGFEAFKRVKDAYGKYKKRRGREANQDEDQQDDADQQGQPNVDDLDPADQGGADVPDADDALEDGADNIAPDIAEEGGDIADDWLVVGGHQPPAVAQDYGPGFDVDPDEFYGGQDAIAEVHGPLGEAVEGGYQPQGYNIAEAFNANEADAEPVQFGEGDDAIDNIFHPDYDAGPQPAQQVADPADEVAQADQPHPVQAQPADDPAVADAVGDEAAEAGGEAVAADLAEASVAEMVIPGLEVVGIATAIGLGVYDIFKSFHQHHEKMPMSAGVSEHLQDVQATTSEI